jgi:hypothetical protein
MVGQPGQQRALGNLADFGDGGGEPAFGGETAANERRSRILGAFGEVEQDAVRGEVANRFEIEIAIEG